ncbi:MAG TPA: hypothetical protein VI790_04490 [Candidatus Nanoarchaeia archaeon]|nr:hypothetical protein [Candidatus Nanoarchaeia archaeon]
MTICACWEATCCKTLMIVLNPYDIAKILDQLDEYTITPNGVTHKGKKVIIINQKKDWSTLKELPNPHLNIPCYFLKNNKCELHDKETGKELSNALTKIGVNTSAKPMICRHHPRYYDTNDRVTLKFKNCHRPNIYEIELTSNKELEKEALITEQIISKMLTHYDKTGDYPIIEIAEELIKGKTEKLERMLEMY